MKKLLSNWEIKALAVLAAIIFWFLVVATENTFYTFPDEIPVKAFNVPEDLVVSDELGTVKLRLKIDNRETLSNLTIDDFSAYIDLEEMQIGEREIEVEVSSKKSDINVVKVEPSKLTVKIAEKAEKEVPLESEIIGDAKEGYLVREVVTSIDRIVIKGAEKSLENIDKALLMIELDGEDDDFTRTFEVAILDDNGEKLENVSVDEPSIEAQVKISAIADQKVAGVQPTIVGSPQENIWIKSINVEPNFVVLKGDLGVLENIEFVKTSDIDVSGISANDQFTVQIIGLPEGVEIEGSNNLTVSIEVDQYDSIDSSMQRTTVKVPILIRKFKTSQKSIKPDPFAVTLVVEGDDADLSKVELELDITGYEGDSALIELSESNFKLPDGVNVVTITPSKVNVSWK
ncbi:YbbR-like domain-containing protein [Patescibacteria group bacterium]